MLESGAVIVRDLPPSGDEGIGVLVVGRVEAKPDDVWAVMADCDEQDEFVPRVVEASVHDRDRDAHTCQLTIDLPFPLDDAQTKTRHQVRRLPDGGMQRYWHLLPGDWGYERNSGSWTVHPEADGRRSLLVNRMDMLPKSAIPTWILQAATSRQAPDTFEAIRSRVAQRARDTASNE